MVKALQRLKFQVWAFNFWLSKRTYGPKRGTCKSCEHLGTGVRGIAQCQECKISPKVTTIYFGTNHCMTKSRDTCPEWEAKSTHSPV